MGGPAPGLGDLAAVDPHLAFAGLHVGRRPPFKSVELAAAGGPEQGTKRSGAIDAKAHLLSRG